MVKKVNVKGVDVVLEKKKIKNMYLRYSEKYNAFCVTYSSLISEKKVMEFIEANIEKMIKKKETKKSTLDEIKDGGFVYIFGAKLILRVVNDKKNYVEIKDPEVFVHIKDESKLDVVYEKFQKDLLKSYLDYAVPIWVDQMGLCPSMYSIRTMKSKWGCCNTKTKKITFSTMLIRKPKEFIDYVICHELAHIQVPNHGEAFKRILDIYYPEWKSIRKLR